MRVSSVLALGLATAAQGAVIQARDSGCTINLQPTQTPPSAAGETITYGSLSRWQRATGQATYSNWVDYAGALRAPYSFKYKANTIPGYQTNAQIKAVVGSWPGTYLGGVNTARENDFLITSVSCN